MPAVNSFTARLISNVRDNLCQYELLYDLLSSAGYFGVYDLLLAILDSKFMTEHLKHIVAVRK